MQPSLRFAALAWTASCRHCFVAAGRLNLHNTPHLAFAVRDELWFLGCSAWRLRVAPQPRRILLDRHSSFGLETSVPALAESDGAS